MAGPATMQAICVLIFGAWLIAMLCTRFAWGFAVFCGLVAAGLLYLGMQGMV